MHDKPLVLSAEPQREARHPTSYYPSFHFEVVFSKAQSASDFHVILACLVLFGLVIEFAELLDCVNFSLPSNTCPQSPLEEGQKQEDCSLEMMAATKTETFSCCLPSILLLKVN